MLSTVLPEASPLTRKFTLNLTDYMTTAQKIILGAVALVGLVALGYTWAHPASAPQTTQTDPTGQSYGATGVNHFEQGVWWFNALHYFGSNQQMSIDTSGNVVTTGTYTSNGVTTYSIRVSSMTAATTTPCVIPLPAATTTLESYAANFTVSSSTAALVTIATSTTVYATTSLITSKTIAASAQGTVDWHPTALNSVNSPSTFIVLGMSGGIGTFSPTGTCNAVVRSVN